METTDETYTACSFPRTRRSFLIKIRPDANWKNASMEDIMQETPAPSSSPVASQSSNDTAAAGFHFNKRKLEEKLNVLATIRKISSGKDDLSDDYGSEEENGQGKSPLTEPLLSLSLAAHPSCDKDGLSIFYTDKSESECFPPFSGIKMSMDIATPAKAPASKKNRSE